MCEDNHIANNVCNENGLVGIWLSRFCDRNHIVNNVADGNRTSHLTAFLANAGIALGHPLLNPDPAGFPRDNLILANEVVDNTTGTGRSFDVLDRALLGGDCANTWRGNNFEVDTEAGSDAGPAHGCLR